MDQQFSSNNDKDKLTINSTKRLSLKITDRHDSVISSSRTLSPVAFFHDNFTINKTDLHQNFMDAQRRAQAIATAPLRKRHDDDKEDDDDDDDQQKKTLLGYIKTSSSPIPLSIESEHPHSLPKTQLATPLLPTFRIDPPPQNNCGQLDYTFNYNSRRNRYPSEPLPSQNKDWKS